MNCTECGEELSPDAKFCEECGTSIPEQKFNCQQCLNTLKKNQKFCGNCGSKIDLTIYLPKKAVCNGKTEDGNLCGATLNPGEKFCSECGHSQQQDKPQPKTDKQAAFGVVEQATGVQGENKDRKSGAKDLPQQAPQDHEKPSKNKKKKKKKKKGKEEVKSEDKAYKENHDNQKEKANSNLEGTTLIHDHEDRKDLQEKEESKPTENTHNDDDDITKEKEKLSTDKKIRGDDHDNQQDKEESIPIEKTRNEERGDFKDKQQLEPAEKTGTEAQDKEKLEPDEKAGNEAQDEEKDKQQLEPAEKTGNEAQDKEKDTQQLEPDEKAGNEAQDKEKDKQQLEPAEKTGNEAQDKEKDKQQLEVDEKAGNEAQDKEKDTQQLKPDKKAGNEAQDKEMDKQQLETAEKTGNDAQDKEKDKQQFEPDEKAGNKAHDQEKDKQQSEPDEKAGKKAHDQEKDKQQFEPDEKAGNKAHDQEKDKHQFEPDEKSGNKAHDQEKDNQQIETEENAGKEAHDKEKDKQQLEPDKKADNEAQDKEKIQDDSGRSYLLQQGVKIKNESQTQVVAPTRQLSHQSLSTSSGGGMKRKTKGMEVHFYAAFAEQFIFDESSETVYLGFAIGRWKMRHVGRITIGDAVFYKYEVYVRFPESMQKDKVYNYNYCVTRTNGDNVMEYVHNNGTNVKCRTFQFKNSSKSEITRRYDGIVRGKHEQSHNKGMFKKAINVAVSYVTGNEKIDHKLLRKDAEYAIQIYTSILELDSFGPEVTKKPSIEIFYTVLQDLGRRYFKEECLWSFLGDFEKFAGKVMHPYIQKCLLDINEKKNQDINVQLQVLCMETSITVLCLFLSYKIDLSAEEKKILCWSLLPHLSHKKSKCEDMEAVKLSVNTTRHLPEQIIDLMRSVINEKNPDPCWMFCVPLLHFLQDRYVPYQEVPETSNHNDPRPVWWGTESFVYEIQTFTKKICWEKPLLNDFAQKIAPYFQLDFLMPRTLTATFQVSDLNKLNVLGVPEDAVLASLYYHIFSAHFNATKLVKECRDIAIKVSTSLRSFAKDKRYSVKAAERINSIAEDLISTCFCKQKSMFARNTNALISVAEVYFVTVHWLRYGLSSEAQGDNESLNYSKRMAAYHVYGNLFCEFVKPNQPYPGEVELETWFRAWSSSFEMKIPEGDVKTDIDSQLKCLQEEELRKMTLYPDDIINIYCSSAESFPNQTQELLSRYAYKVLEHCKNLESVQGKLKNDTERQKKYGMLLSSVFERSLDEKKLQYDNNLLFLHALSWAPFATFVKMFYNASYNGYLRTTIVAWMTKFLQSLNIVWVSLLDGSITLKNLEVIRNHEEQFISIILEMKYESLDRHHVFTLIQVRLKELKKFQETMTNVQNFMYICENSGGNAKDLEDEILGDNSIKQLCSLVKVKLSSATENIETYQPIVHAFSLDSEILNALSDVLECKSKCFMQLLRLNGSELARQYDRPLTTREVYAEVWKPSYNFWKSMCSRLKNGQILFSELKKYFDTRSETALREIFDQIRNKDDENEWVEQRLHQFRKYTSIISCSVGAHAILNVVKTYELVGDFSQITEIDRLTKGDDTSMNTIDEKLVETCSILSGIDDLKAECLNIFADSKDLVVWLRETMPTGQKELKVFVDLASITAGEGDIEIAKVNCLHAATTGFAPLIFSLTSDCNEQVFLDKCNEIWKTLSTDNNLGTKLVDTRRQLQWLKSVKKSHGSVEVTSLSQADAINEIGIYKIGNWTKRNINENMTITDVLELILPETKSSPMRRYSFQKLNDLQSRLMLVAGKADKGKESVDRFMLILDSVVRLGQIYIKLLTDGCVLFSKWYVNLLCDKTRPACVHIHFGEGTNKVTLKGKVDSHNEDVIAIIPRVAKFLEQCHDKWLEYISEKRDTFYQLNYFTIDQMVILQRELVKLCSEKEPSVLIYPLLSAVKSNCTEEELKEAMHSAKAVIDEKESTQDCQDDRNETQAAEMSEDDKTVAFIKQLKEAGFDIELAWQALQHVDSADDIDQGVVWCMENEKEYKEIKLQEELRKEAEKAEKERYKQWTDTSDSISSITADIITKLGLVDENSVGKLLTALEELWDTFLNSISSSVSDYLSVEHLGIILDKLKEKAQKDKAQLSRKFFAGFTEGEPNLMICSQSEIWNTVLSVYNQGDTVSLPLSDEVLVCTNTTTFDMLETFWRRSLFSKSHGIFCLVNADLLNYDVSDRGERALERFMKHPLTNESKYRLVVICSSENEYKSRIVAFLAKYHKQQLPTDVGNIRNYLVKEFASQQEGNETFEACIVDHERCNVRVVKSWRAGVGKTLYKKRMVDKLLKQFPDIERKKPIDISVTLHEKCLNIDDVMDVFIDETLSPAQKEPRIFHIDIAHEVEAGVDFFLFQLLILGCLHNSSGYVWRKSHIDYYIIESMPLLAKDADLKGGKVKYVHHCLEILPSLFCRGPQESQDVLSNRTSTGLNTDILFDEIEFKSSTFQRPYHYLKRYSANGQIDFFNPDIAATDASDCLQELLKYCGIKDPSWSELYHFVSFLNKQLDNFEGSTFCSLAAMGNDLPGFPKFVLRFLILMSRDFSTRSLKVSEESPTTLINIRDTEGTSDDNVVEQYGMRRTWEKSPHPYLFFNPDGHTMTFLGFDIDRKSGDLRDQQSGTILETSIIRRDLFDILVKNGVNLNENFDKLPRAQKLEKLRQVMGSSSTCDPDPTYELTTDNVKKILAIYMRFRCDIPVLIMGETGCGKTRLIRFMCSLQLPSRVPRDSDEQRKNMILMKVHGGTKASDIIRKVQQAEEIASKNAEMFPNMFTVLFFDEANTTEAIGVIKEIMCDKSISGKPIKLHQRLKIIAACNPYRKHSEELIKKLEQAGLGYHVDAENTTDRLGRVPMRRLVYRVQPLPQSMLPLVWDFGQLSTDVEEMYTRQMVLRYINNGDLPHVSGLDTVLSKILTVSQNFMRDQMDECSFVSLRDVDRVLTVMSWFITQCEDNSILYQAMNTAVGNTQNIDVVTRSLILSLGICYHACLKRRVEYRETVVKHFKSPLILNGGAVQMETEILKCQAVFLDNVVLNPNIASNQALKENVFMMIVCIELRIPLFLVGKPGSSKSLSKTIVADAMQGNAARNDLFRILKEVQMISYQCSPLSVPEGIVAIFRQCGAYQKDKDLNRFASVAVLDEIGLAEDSPKMPLKTLHPLLEDGCPDDEEPEPYKKVAFIGISNWALDPAKMNRGILVQREVPDKTELIESASGICSSDKYVLTLISPLIEPMAISYLQLFENASKEMREFFGLRDFYSLVKMLYAFLFKSQKKPTWAQLQHSILRNFGGLEVSVVDPVHVFGNNLEAVIDKSQEPTADDPDCSSSGMIKACLTDYDKHTESQNRYLLLLTENYGALTILQQAIFSMQNAVVIFGSSFPSDQEYTQVCRNINRIKVCMETGSTVILLNLENLYESLYDALNQYYVVFGGQRYVDLGLGSHRVKCRINKKFRLIVVAEKQIVYDKFPIPLINRLEKHFLSMKTMLSPEQCELAGRLQIWAEKFCEEKFQVSHNPRQKKQKKKKIGDVFMGYHADTCASIISNICHEQTITNAEDSFLSAKKMLLWCATPASVFKYGHSQELDIYLTEQHHESLSDYFGSRLLHNKKENIFAQVTTNSKLMSTTDLDILCTDISIERRNMTLLTLQSFDTEQQFRREIRSNFINGSLEDFLLVVQCESGDTKSDLVACARYVIQGELQQIQRDKGVSHRIHVIFLIQLPGIAGACFTGFQCGSWHSVHIDDIHQPVETIPSLSDLYGKSVGEILASKKEEVIHGGDVTSDAGIEESDVAQDEKPCDKTHFNFTVEYIIRKCVQSSVSCVKDPADDSPRTTDRLQNVIWLIQQSKGDESVLAGIIKHLINTLKEKERHGETLSARWLFTESSKTENINSAGTFRNCLIQCLESKVTPVLADIIASLDTNRNLDIVTHGLNEWKGQLWRYLFNLNEIIPVNLTAQKEFTVKTTARNGNAFSAIMPFSWIIFYQIDEILKNTISSEKDEENYSNLIMKAAETCQEMPLGYVLANIEGTNIHQALKDYIYDFVQMKHFVTSDLEHQFVRESIYNGCKNLIPGEFGRLLPSMFGFHVMYLVFETRFHNFSNIVSIWPSCCKKLQDNVNDSLNTDEEMTLDVFALTWLLQDLKPNNEEINKPDTRMKWFNRVARYRPIIERVIGHFNDDKTNGEQYYGPRCINGMSAIRYQWTRIHVVKLFIEHVCTLQNKDESSNRCMPFWVILGKTADLKTKSSFEKVETFLTKWNENVIKQYFGELAKCTSCYKSIESAPVTLPCRHIICLKCYRELVILLEQRECTLCHELIPEHIDLLNEGNRGDIANYNEFRRRCNSFFLDIVSQLCFAERTPPSQEVIEKLFSYVVSAKGSRNVERRISKELTIFGDSIDPTPVVRSFLLQQLIQTSGDDIDSKLKMYFQCNNDLIEDSGTSKERLDLCCLIMQCLEDSEYQNYTCSYNEEGDATTMLQECIHGFELTVETVETMKYISQTKIALQIVAKYIHHFYGGAPTPTTIDNKYKMLFEAAGKLCEECNSPWPRRYFVKQLCRRFGIESYQKVLKEKHEDFLKWTELPELLTKKLEECHDRYIVCGEDYRQFREGITQAIMSEKGDNLKSVIQTSRRDWKSTIKILLAVHREITMKNVYTIDDHIPKEKKDVVKECIYEQFPHVQQFTDRLLDNNLWSADDTKNIQEGMELSGQNTVCLLTHFWLMISQIPGQTCIIAPLKKIATEPDKMLEAFLPTMPHDEKYELLQHLRQMTETDGTNISLKYYRCPNGHIYVIGDCGRPWVKGKCNECGADIGGKYHNASDGNAALEIIFDATLPGHILGAPSARDTKNVAVERKLAGISLPLVRLLLHMSLFVGSNINLQAITQTIKNPEIQEEEVASFLLQHISADLETMQNVIGKNKDDVLLIVHQFLFALTELHTSNVIADNKPEDYCVLKTKDIRELWENEFVKLYVEPMKQNMEKALNENNAKIMDDRRLGADPLLQLLYETEDSQQEVNITKLYDNPAVWRYREQISIPNLRRVLSNSESDYPVLLLFLKEEHHLRAIRFIPSILRLQKMLLQRYNRKLEKSETYLIRRVKHDMKIDGKQDEFLQLLFDFKEAWKIICQSLENYACHTKTATVQLDLKYCRTSIDDKTPLSLFLPTHKGLGLCSYMLVAFLLEKQNTFMEQYCKWNKIGNEHLPTVQVNDISSAHLISYHPDKDLLPLLLANCNYTFEMGKGTKIEYNYRDLERQIMDRFLFSKSRITNIKEIETFTYRAEFTSSGVFHDLIKIVKQERLHSAIQAQISEELSKKLYPDLCQGLDVLDIAISFLKSVKTDPDLSLHEFMTRTLKIESPLPSYKAQQAAKCKHTMSLWMTMAIERTKCQARYDKGTFDGTSDFLKLQLSDDHTNAVKEALNGFQIEQTSLLLEVLYELIVLMLDVPIGTGDDYVDISAMSMKDSILGYIGASLFEEDPQKEDILTEIVHEMFPKDISSSQAVEVWNLTNEILMDKLYAKK